MALRNQPYFPLYVQDFLTDEKLIECSAESTGVYIRLLCLMHKSDEYGTILLKQKYKQTESTCLNFAYMIAKQMPYSEDVVNRSLEELLQEGVLLLEDDKLIQKRMVKDNELSLVRSKAGSTGGKVAQAKVKANIQANTEYEIVNENDNVITNRNKFILPTKEQVKEYAISRNRLDLVDKFFDYYSEGDWKDKDGKKVKNWKQKFITWENRNTEGAEEKSYNQRLTEEMERRYAQ